MSLTQQVLSLHQQHAVIIELSTYLLFIKSSLCSHTSFLVVPPFRAPGGPLAAEERVQGGGGEDACKFSYDFTKHIKTLTEKILCTRENKARHLCEGRPLLDWCVCLPPSINHTFQSAHLKWRQLSKDILVSIMKQKYEICGNKVKQYFFDNNSCVRNVHEQQI